MKTELGKHSMRSDIWTKRVQTRRNEVETVLSLALPFLIQRGSHTHDWLLLGYPPSRSSRGRRHTAVNFAAALKSHADAIAKLQWIARYTRPGCEEC